jgi:hypothetical protein
MMIVIIKHAYAGTTESFYTSKSPIGTPWPRREDQFDWLAPGGAQSSQFND